MIWKFAALLTLAIVACADAGGSQDAAERMAGTNASAPPRFEPNTGTAPDYLVNCIGQAQRRYGVAQDAVRLEDPANAPDGGVTIAGVANRANGPARFRCHFDRDLAFREIEDL